MWDYIALFLQIGVSLIGTLIPLLARKYGRKWIGDYEFSLFKHLGAGIILSTGFIHMLTPAFVNLTSPCLPDPWLEYNAYAGLFAMLAILFIQFIQTMAVAYLHNSELSNSVPVADGWTPIASPQTSPAKSPTSSENGSMILDGPVNGDVEMLHTHNGHGQPANHNHNHFHEHDAAEIEHVHSLLLAHRQQRQIMVYILEVGIATHSFIIGLAVGVARGSELTALMIAVAFHQESSCVRVNEVFKLTSVSSTVLRRHGAHGNCSGR
jgi:zinc transporter 1/2/3